MLLQDEWPASKKKASGFVHEWVRHQSEVHPERAAIVDKNGRPISYGRLMQRSSRLRGQLLGLGVGPDRPVAVLMSRSPQLFVAMLAVLGAGGVYAPIDPSLPRKRIAAMLENLHPAAIVADEDASGWDLPALVVGSGEDAAPLLNARFPRPFLRPRHLAYVLYTSGSTGPPKGVGMSHRGLTRLIRWQIAQGPPGLATLQFTSLGFDVTFQEVFSALCTGGALFLLPDEVRRDPERLLYQLKEKSIQRLFLPYVALQQLAKASQRLGLVPDSLRHVITAGERLIITKPIARFFQALPECRFDNHYGPTEAHLVTSYTLAGKPSAWPPLPPIGSPVDDVALYNLDPNLVPVKPGQTGELFVGGEGVGRGYLEAPAETARRFLPDPFSEGQGARMYRTGDLARVDTKGLFHFLGRSDAQVKINGFRVEPAEVEKALTDHPAVGEAAVLARPLAEDVSALVAFLVVHGERVSDVEVLGHLRSLLPSYMIPARLVQLEALPQTSSGKIDRLALQELELPPMDGDVSTGDSLAEAIRRIWERILGHDQLALDDDFFDVGGDSLLAAWAVTEIGQLVGSEIELSFLLHNSTVAELARALDTREFRREGLELRSEVVTIRPGPPKRPLLFVHPLGGELLAYRELAHAIRSPFRILGLRWHCGEQGDPACMGSIEEMAKVHFTQLRAVQPRGPYRLAGWSFGGVLAFELARQLTGCGERVDFLGLIDANPLRDPITGLRIAESPHLDLLTEALQKIETGTVGAGDGKNGLSRFFADPAWNGLLGNNIPQGLQAAHLKKNLRVARDSMGAAMKYRPLPFDGAVDLFQPTGSSQAVQDSLAVELHKIVLGPMRIHAVPGDHCSILRQPLAASTARALDEALSSIRSG